jgi:hypothetical protein
MEFSCILGNGTELLHFLDAFLVNRESSNRVRCEFWATLQLSTALPGMYFVQWYDFQRWMGFGLNLGYQPGY